MNSVLSDWRGGAGNPRDSIKKMVNGNLSKRKSIGVCSNGFHVNVPPQSSFHCAYNTT